MRTAWVSRLVSISAAFFFGVCAMFVFLPSTQAATCSITTATVVDQAYVNNNSCTAIEINGNVSTTWIGTVDLGGGTVTVKSGYTMTMGSSSAMVLGANDDFIVESNATTTHLKNDISGIQITARNITVTGKINADAKGCNGGGAATIDGSGPHASTGVCTISTTGYGRTSGSGGGGGSGGTHGGLGSAGRNSGGATSTIMYGDSLNPILLGSGGGQGYYTVAYGGHGGGRVTLTANGVLTVSGSISANGGDGGASDYPPAYQGGGAGSGGSISIVATSLAGAGTISANGGVGGLGNGTNGNGGGHGGGGRVAVRYGATSLSLENISAAGGAKAGWTSGQNGSTYLLNRIVDDGAGTLTITSGFDFPVAGDHTRDAIAVSSGAYLRCPYAATTTSITVHSAAWISLSNATVECTSAVSQFTISSAQGLSTTSTVMTFSGTTSVRVDVPTWTNVTTTISATHASGEFVVDVDNPLEFRGFSYTGPSIASTVYATGTFFVLNAGSSVSFVSSTIRSNTSSTIAGALTLDSNSSLNADGRGCLRGKDFLGGYGPHATTGVCKYLATGYGKGGTGGGYPGGGAAHGGAGGKGESWDSAQTTTYGSSTNPWSFGSGGGSGFDAFGNTQGEGGNGGGIIRLRVGGATVVSGTVTAKGIYGNNEAAYGYGGGAGGSGGSIYLYVGSLSGNGTISAAGGAGGLGGNGGTGNDAGGGGGGRIAIYYSSYSGTAFSGASVAGGSAATGAVAGSSGSLYTFQTNIAPDAPGSLGSLTLTNGSTTGTVTPVFTFTLSDSDVADTVKFQIQIDNSADFGSLVIDYTSALAAQGSTSFQVGQSAGSGAYAAGTSGQSLTDGSYYWRVKTIDANAAESSYTTANSGSVAFIVDSATRTISFQYGTGSGAESVTATSVRIVLDTTHFEDVTVEYSVSSTMSTAAGGGEDYTLASGTATIIAGQTSTTIALTLVNDDIDEPNEVVQIDLASPVFATLGVTNEFAYTITDNDTAGITASTDTLSLTEGGSVQTMTLVLDAAPTSTVSVAFSTSTNGITISPVSLSFTSVNWATPQTITISATDDSVYESSHATTVQMTVTGGVYGYPSITPPTITATITDNETSNIMVSASNASTDEGDAVSITYTLASQPTSTVTLLFTIGSGITASTSSVIFTTSDWSTPQSVTYTATENQVYTGNRSATVSTAVRSDTAFAGVSIPALTIEIVEDDPQPSGGGVGAFGIPIPVFTPYVPPPIRIAMVTPTAPIALPPTTSPTTPNTTQSQTNILPTITNRITQDLREFGVQATEASRVALTWFVQEGTSSASKALGEGERRAVVRDALETLRRSDVPLEDLERLASGQIPKTRNLAEEQKQVARALPTFKTLYGGRAPNFKNAEENLAWNALLYRIRFPRDLKAEQQGVKEFRARYGRDPKDPFQWATVRVMGYVQK